MNYPYVSPIYIGIAEQSADISLKKTVSEQVNNVSP